MFIEQVGSQGNLGRLVLHVPAQVGAPHASAQTALGLGEELLGRVVGAFDDGHYAARLVASDGMPAQSVLVALQVLQHDRLGHGSSVARTVRKRLDALAEGVAVSLQACGHRLQQGCGCARAGRRGGLAPP